MEFRLLLNRLSHLKPSKLPKISTFSPPSARNFSQSPQFQNPNLTSLYNHSSISSHFSRCGFSQNFLPKLIQIESFSSKSDPLGAQNVIDQSKLIAEMKSVAFRDETLEKLFAEMPLAIMKDSVGINKKSEILVFFGLNMDEINRILYIFPGYFALNYETRLKPLIQELDEIGFSKNEIKQVIFENPKLFLTMETGEISRYVKLLESLKCRQPIKEKILIKGFLSASMNVKLRIECLCKHGLKLRDAFKVLFVEPRVILYNLEDIETKIEFLLHKMKFSMEHLIECPEYLGVNLEKQIIPRHNVLEYLRSVGGLGDEIWMKHYVKMSRIKFFNFFVKPYPECQRIFEEGKRGKEVMPRHPVGMWRLFKPRKFWETGKDVRNMKEFMKPVVKHLDSGD